MMKLFEKTGFKITRKCVAQNMGKDTKWFDLLSENGTKEGTEGRLELFKF
jgi:hypothetical protein